MGADLYNKNYLQAHPMLVAIQMEMKSLTHDMNGKWRKLPLPDADQERYRQLYDKLYDDPRYYFREGYGGQGLLSLMGLSWWRDVVPLADILCPTGLTDEEAEEWYEANPNNMSPEACQQFIDLLQSRRAIVDAYPDDEIEEGTDWDGNRYRTNVGGWYRERLERLLEFLRGGVEYGGIYASL